MRTTAIVNRAVRAVSDDQRIIEGIASTADVDRMGDVINPLGAKFSLPLPFLLDHDHRQSVGHVESAEVTKSGIKFRARIAQIEEPGEAAALCDKAWALIKSGLRPAVSVGFRALDFGYDKENDGLIFNEWEWLELSAVTVPANPAARITGIKSFGDLIIYTAPAPRSETVRLIRAADAVKNMRGTVQLMPR